MNIVKEETAVMQFMLMPLISAYLSCQLSSSPSEGLNAFSSPKCRNDRSGSGNNAHFDPYWYVTHMWAWGGEGYRYPPPEG